MGIKTPILFVTLIFVNSHYLLLKVEIRSEVEVQQGRKSMGIVSYPSCVN